MYVDSGHSDDIDQEVEYKPHWLLGTARSSPLLKTLVLGAEFVTMKQSIDEMGGTRYSLQMTGVTFSGPTIVHDDNMSVNHDTTKPESTFKKNCNSMWPCSYVVYFNEGIINKAHLWQEKCADLITKVFYGHKIKYLVLRMSRNILRQHWSIVK